MGLAVFTFIAIFVLIGSAGLLMFYRDAMRKRLASAVSPNAETENPLNRVLRVRAESIGALVEPLQRVLPRSAEETSVVQKRLMRAGYRKDWHVNIFYGAKVLVPGFLCLIATVTGLYQSGPFFVYAIALGLGFLAPDFWVGRRISARQLNIRLGLPEALDFMVICIEAGLSLDQAVLRTSDELHVGQPDLSDELSLVNLEQRAGVGRADAWRRLAERTDVDAVKGLTGLIIQVDQFGTSIARALRVHSDTLRTQRRQTAEEKAAKTAVKLVFPLVLFIFPSIFVVVLGPAMIVIMESFAKYF